jgi:hypothetical protein
MPLFTAEMPTLVDTTGRTDVGKADKCLPATHRSSGPPFSSTSGKPGTGNIRGGHCRNDGRCAKVFVLCLRRRLVVFACGTSPRPATAMITASTSTTRLSGAANNETQPDRRRAAIAAVPSERRPCGRPQSGCPHPRALGVDPSAGIPPVASASHGSKVVDSQARGAHLGPAEHQFAGLLVRGKYTHCSQPVGSTWEETRTP